MEMKDLKVGMKFVVVSNKVGEGWNESNRMDKWLGKIMTVRVADVISLKANEDYGECCGEGWTWCTHMINWEATEELNKPKPIDLLETGYVVETQNKNQYLVLKGDLNTLFFGKQNLCLINNRGFLPVSNFNSDLENNDTSLTINKIYKRNVVGLEHMLEIDSDHELIWERPQPNPKVVKITSTELLEKMGLDKDTKLEIEW